MMTHVQFFKLYAAYIRDYRKSQLLLDALLERRRFRDWLDLNELCAGYALKQLLLAPVTRLPQYLLFLSAIVRSLDQESAAAVSILSAVSAMEKVASDIAEALKHEVARKLVVTLQTRIFGGNCNLVSPHRYVVKHSVSATGAPTTKPDHPAMTCPKVSSPLIALSYFGSCGCVCVCAGSEKNVQ